MDAARKRLWWKAGGAALLAAICGLAFAAYFSPAMQVEFTNLWAFCAGLLR
jgi:hypothetical protein